VRYFAEVDADNIVVRVIVADTLEWCVENLGGTWLETADPYSDEPQEVEYCGPGWVADPSSRLRFAPPWTPPGLDDDGYPEGAVVGFDRAIFESTVDHNTNRPDESGWRRPEAAAP
jgi:hypothetical protein